MSRSILLVEDEPRIADFVVRGLGEEGYQIVLAPDGSAGRIALDTGTWDLVILDWWLPGEDGVELLRRLRRRDRVTPVLFLSARDAVSDRVIGLDSGADDYLTKPFSFEELLARVRALLRRVAHADAATLDFQDVRADLASQRASRDGHPLDLTAKEFALLALFLRRPGTVFSRARIYETVWGDHYGGVSNTLEVHVKELRRKLELHGPRIIQTRRGRGYVLEAATDATRDDAEE